MKQSTQTTYIAPHWCVQVLEAIGDFRLCIGIAWCNLCSHTKSLPTAPLGRCQPIQWMTPGSWTAVPHLLTRGTSEEHCECSLVGLLFLVCVICVSYWLFYPLMNSHQRLLPFIIIELDLCISLVIGFTAGVLYQLEHLHAAVSCLLIGSNNGASVRHPVFSIPISYKKIPNYLTKFWS